MPLAARVLDTRSSTLGVTAWGLMNTNALRGGGGRHGQAGEEQALSVPCEGAAGLPPRGGASAAVDPPLPRRARASGT